MHVIELRLAMDNQDNVLAVEVAGTNGTRIRAQYLDDQHPMYASVIAILDKANSNSGNGVEIWDDLKSLDPIEVQEDLVAGGKEPGRMSQKQAERAAADAEVSAATDAGPASSEQP